MTSRASLLILCRELENDFSYIQEASALCARAELRVEGSSWNDEMDLLTLGSAFHTLYNAMEGYFMRIAKFFENNVDRVAWHRDLLDRMALDVPGVRPALLPSRDLVDRIDELRRFRHLFRNLYKTRLHPGKLKIVNDSVHGLADEFRPPHHSFIAWLREVAAALEG